MNVELVTKEAPDILIILLDGQYAATGTVSDSSVLQ